MYCITQFGTIGTIVQASLAGLFRTNLVVHHQEHSIIYCITQFGTIGTIVQTSLAGLFRMNLVVHHQEHVIIYCIIQSGTIVHSSLSAMKL
jgi:hypothetical protein